MRAGCAGVPSRGPALRGDRERLLGGFLGELEVAEEADQRREDASPLVAEDLLEARSAAHHSWTGRTSTAPPQPRRRDAGRQLDRGVEVVRLEHEVAAERLLDRDEGPVGGQRLAVLDANRRGGLRSVEPCPGVTPGVWLIAW